VKQGAPQKNKSRISNKPNNRNGFPYKLSFLFKPRKKPLYSKEPSQVLFSLIDIYITNMTKKGSTTRTLYFLCYVHGNQVLEANTNFIQPLLDFVCLTMKDIQSKVSKTKKTTATQGQTHTQTNGSNLINILWVSICSRALLSASFCTSDL